MTFNVGSSPALSFLGFGLHPPAADWGLMINENRNGADVQPWPVLLPVIAIALLTIGTSLIGDGIARALDRHRARGRAANEHRHPALEVVDLRVEVEYGGAEDIVDGIAFHVAAGEVLGLVGESGSGQDDRRPGAARPHAARRAHRRRRGPHRGPRHARAPAARAPAAARHARLLRAAGPVVGAQPGAADRHAARRGAVGARLRRRRTRSGASASPRCSARCCCPSDDAFLRRYPHQLSGGQQQRVGARDGLRLPAAGDRARRADDRPRRHHAGARARRPCATCARAHGVAAALRQPRPRRRRQPRRPRRRHVRRPARRGRADGRRCSAKPRIRTRAGSSRRSRRCRASTPSSAYRDARRARATGPTGCFFAPRCDLRQDAAGAESAARVDVAPGTRSAASDMRRGPPTRCGRSRRGAADEPRSRSRTRSSRSAACAPLRDPQVLHDIDLALAPRECLALVGESGSGKTTLARCIAGLHTALHGRDLLPRTAAAAGRARARRGHAPRDPVRLPEPVQLAQPAEHHRRRSSAQPLRHFFARGGSDGARESGQRSSGSALARRASTATRTSCPAASASAWRSPGRWSPSHSSSSATRSPPRSTSPCRRRSSSCSRSCSASSTSGSSSSRTTSR